MSSVLKFPKKVKPNPEKEAQDKRMKEADERINRGEATEEDIELYVEEFTELIDGLNSGDIELLFPPPEIRRIVVLTDLDN